MQGDIIPILERLDNEVNVVISGHTHRAYNCNYKSINSQKNILLTSAGQYGTVLTEIELTFAPLTRKSIKREANNVIIQSEPYIDSNGQYLTTTTQLPQVTKDIETEKIVQRYKKASEDQSQKIVGFLKKSITSQSIGVFESSFGDLIADAQLWATQSKDKGNAEIAFMNPGGIRADLIVPINGGPVTYGEVFRAQPFANQLIVKALKGRELKALLEEQFSKMNKPRVLFTSKNLSYEYHPKNPQDQKIKNILINLEPMIENKEYRITMNNYLAEGGNGFNRLKNLPIVYVGPLDVDALADYLHQEINLLIPEKARIRIFE